MNVDLAHLRPLAPDALEGVEGRVDGRREVRGELEPFGVLVRQRGP